jgi:glycosyltransferase involved in cell wall biosynthesis
MISVIIRNRNEKEYIGFAIQSVLDNFNDPEIIIVDNDSTDDSMKVVSMFDNANIKKDRINGAYTPGKSLNYGVTKATYDTILILSAHSQITDMSIEYVEEKLKDNVAVFGKQTPIYRGKKITPRYVWSHFNDKEKVNLFSKIENRQFLHNAFCFYKKDILKKYPFDENLSGKEDRYWAIDRVKDKMNYLYTPKLKANHYWTSNGATWKGLG